MQAIICVSHSGELELKTAFFLYSLKKHLIGDYKIYVCIPESTSHFSEPSAMSMNYYDKLNIELRYFKNPIIETRKSLLKGDLTSNKIYALSLSFTEDFIFFFDSDIVALQKFNLESVVSEVQDIIIKPANRSNISSWEKIYSLVGQPVPDDTVLTSVDRKRIPPYFNAGVIGLNNAVKDKFCQTWTKYFEQMWEENDIRKFGIPAFHRDQVALSLALNELNLQFNLLPGEYNYPLRGKKISKDNIPYLAHYHRPYMVYSSGILKHEFMQFLDEYSEFEQMVGDYPEWEKLFGSDPLTAGIAGLKEAIRYKKFNFTKNIRKRLNLK